MSADLNSVLGPALIAVLVVFSLYRRVRRNVGRQKLRPASLIIRGALFVVICGVFLVSPFMTATDFIYPGTGALLGIGLAAFALRHTKFENTPKGIFYTGHPYIGLGVSALLIGRILYRLVEMYPMMSGVGGPSPAGGNPLAALSSSPTTLGSFFLMAGYYIAYSIGILAMARHLPSAGAVPRQPGI